MSQVLKLYQCNCSCHDGSGRSEVVKEVCLCACTPCSICKVNIENPHLEAHMALEHPKPKPSHQERRRKRFIERADLQRTYLDPYEIEILKTRLGID